MADIRGDDGNNNVPGNDGTNVIAGGGGDDTVRGGGGNDSLSGGQGNDQISGGQGDDSIYGGQGNDTINGGQGDDYAVYKGNFSDYTITTDPVTGRTIVHDNNLADGDEGTDTLRNIEHIRFADRDFTI